MRMRTFHQIAEASSKLYSGTALLHKQYQLMIKQAVTVDTTMEEIRLPIQKSNPSWRLLTFKIETKFKSIQNIGKNVCLVLTYYYSIFLNLAQNQLWSANFIYIKMLTAFQDVAIFNFQDTLMKYLIHNPKYIKDLKT